MAQRRSLLWRQARTGFTAAAEALFPANTLGAPDWRDTDMVPRWERWLGELPRSSRTLLLLLFATLETTGPLLKGRPGRLSRRPVAERLELVRNLRASSREPLRLMGDAIKSATTMMYLSHPAALAYVGERRACDHPADPFPVPFAPGALTSEGP